MASASAYLLSLVAKYSSISEFPKHFFKNRNWHIFLAVKRGYLSNILIIRSTSDLSLTTQITNLSLSVCLTVPPTAFAIRINIL